MAATWQCLPCMAYPKGMRPPLCHLSPTQPPSPAPSSPPPPAGRVCGHTGQRRGRQPHGHHAQGRPAAGGSGASPRAFDHAPFLPCHCPSGPRARHCPHARQPRSPHAHVRTSRTPTRWSLSLRARWTYKEWLVGITSQPRPNPRPALPSRAAVRPQRPTARTPTAAASTCSTTSRPPPWARRAARARRVSGPRGGGGKRGVAS